MKFKIEKKLIGSSLHLFPVVGLLAILTFLAACGGDIGHTSTITTEDNPTTSLPTTSLPMPGPFEIFITESGFVPDKITITAGNELTWINKDDTWRAVGEAIPTGESAFEKPYGLSGKLQPGETYTQKFNITGIWEFWCPKTLQTGMVVIEEAE